MSYIVYNRNYKDDRELIDCKCSMLLGSKVLTFIK